MLDALLARFEVLRLNVTLQLQGDCSLPAYKGSMWHGWLGHALKLVSEPAFAACYQQHDHEQPKPYAIQPGWDQKTEWQQHEIIQFGLALFGDAVSLLPAMIHAVQAGQQLGVGLKRTKVKLIAVEAITPDGLSLQLKPQPLQQWLKPSTLLPGSLGLHFHTPLRLKQQGQLVRHAELITPRLLASQARRRLLQLTRYWVADDEALLAAIHQAPLGTDAVQLHTELYFEDWLRYSLKQHEFQPFGGLKGYASCTGSLGQFYLWLQLGALLQIGGKTTFGLGCFSLAADGSALV